MNCILCDQTLPSNYGPDITAHMRIDCPICKSYRYTQRFAINYKSKFYGDKFQENRHKLSGYFFELNEYYRDPEHADVYEQMNLPLDNYEKILKSSLIPDDSDYKAKIKKFLSYLNFKAKGIGNRVEVATINEDIADYLRPIFYAKTKDEVVTYIEECISKNFIGNNIQFASTLQTGGIIFHPTGLHLTLRGFDYVRENDIDSKQIFVAMAFNKEMFEIFYSIKDEITRATGDYRLYIISEREHNQNIDDEIIAAIKQSKAVIADFTHGNQGAYYEAGYAHGKGMEVIFTCREKEFNDEDQRPHFDINHRNFIVWKDAEELKKKLINRINATIQ